MSILETLIEIPQGSPRTAPPKAPSRAKQITVSGVPNLFNYQNYRNFLQDWFKHKKENTPHFSGAIFAKKAGFNSHTLLAMVIRGQRNLSPTTIRRFGQALELNSRESIYFEKLVLFCQATNSSDKTHYLEQVLSLSQGQGRDILTRIQNHALYLSHWYFVAIRELVAVPGFRADPDWIVQKLKRKITRKQAQEAWQVLLNLGLVAKDERPSAKEDGYRIVHPSLDIDPGSVDFAIRNFHKEFLDRAKEAIDGEPLEERELSSLTLAIEERHIARLREKIKDFRRQLNQEFPPPSENGDQPAGLLAINTQVLVLTQNTKPIEKGNKEKKEG